MISLIGRLDFSARQGIQTLNNQSLVQSAQSSAIETQKVLLQTKLLEMQESVEVYERLNLKAEYIYAYRMLIFLLLQAGDYNALGRELAKFISTSPG